jgi:hypothetical protein
MSQKQIEANRRNARKSTGPKTAEGRAVSKMNAMKHGLLSREIVVRGVNVRESAREYEALRERFRNHYKPDGPEEEMLVELIVQPAGGCAAWWRRNPARLRSAWTADRSTGASTARWKAASRALPWA